MRVGSARPRRILPPPSQRWRRKLVNARHTYRRREDAGRSVLWHSSSGMWVMGSAPEELREADISAGFMATSTEMHVIIVSEAQ